MLDLNVIKKKSKLKKNQNDSLLEKESDILEKKEAVFFDNLIKKALIEINKKQKYRNNPKNIEMEYSEFIRYSENMEMLSSIMGFNYFDFNKEIPLGYQIVNTDNKFLIENNIYCLEDSTHPEKKNKYLLLHDIKNVNLEGIKEVEIKEIAICSLKTMNLLLSQNNEIKATVDVEKGASEYINELFTFSKINKASDIKFSLKNFQLIVRILLSNGWRTVSVLDRKQAETIRSYLEVKAGVESGSYRYDSIINYEDEDFRINFFLTAHGYRATIRLPNSDFKAFKSLSDIGYTKDVELMVAELAKAKNGMIILSAPTGNGKTTTQNIILEQLAKRGSEVVSVEHPVEKNIKGIDQVDTSMYVTADTENKVTNKTILKDFLRAKPDIINGGELRDEDDYKIGLEIALTGHLFFGSTHSLNVKTTLRRFVKNGVDEEDIKSLVRGIVCQTLVRRLCDHCKVSDGEGGYKTSQVGCKFCRYGYDNTLTPVVEIASFSPIKDWKLYDSSTYKKYISLQENVNKKYELGEIDKQHRDALINGDSQPMIFELIEEKYLQENDKKFI